MERGPYTLTCHGPDQEEDTSSEHEHEDNGPTATVEVS